MIQARYFCIISKIINIYIKRYFYISAFFQALIIVATIWEYTNCLLTEKYVMNK